MPADSSRARKFRELAEKGDHQGFEDLWLRSLDEAPTDVASFLAGADALASQGIFEKSGMYLSLLVPKLLELELHHDAIKALRIMADVSPRERGLRHGLLVSYRSLYGEDPRIEKLIELSGLAEGKDLKSSIKKMDLFLGFKEGAYLFHPAGWGPGRIAAVDGMLTEVVIDFGSRKGHRISLEMAAKVTEFISDVDIRAYKLDRMDELRDLIENNPAEVVRAALRSRRGKATQREIKDRLVEDVMDAKAWTRWWTKAKQVIKAAPDITMTPGSNPSLELAEDSGGYAEACLRDLRLLPTGARRIRYFRDLLKEASTQEDGPRAISSIAASLTGPKGDAAHLDLGCRISLSFLLKEAASEWPVLPHYPEMALEKLVTDTNEIVSVLPSIPIAGHRTSLLLALRKRNDVDWASFCEQLVLAGEPDSSDYAMACLVRDGHAALVAQLTSTILERARELPQAFMWYLRSYLADRLPAVVRKESKPALLEKALVLHSHLDTSSMRDSDDEKKSLAKSLANTLSNREFAFIQEAFEGATISETASLAALLKGNRSLNSDIKDRMLAVMFRTRPETGKFGSTSPTGTAENPLFDPGIMYTTERALVRKRAEYEDVVNNQIPENAAEIGRAASYGDLSENSEWTAAIEKQERLTKQAEQLGEEIGKARIIDPTLQDGRTVTLGSRVSVEAQDGSVAEYTILGPWDVDSSRGFISYLSPLGHALVGHGVSDEVLVQVPSGVIKYVIKSLNNGLSAGEASA